METCKNCNGPKFFSFSPVCGDCLSKLAELHQTVSRNNIVAVDFRKKRPPTKVLHFPGAKNVIHVDFKAKKVLGRSA